MSVVRTGIPPQIEHQLLALDKQIRDAAFVRGAARTVLGICLFLGGGLLLDGLFALSTTVRACLLAGWFVVAIVLLWRGVVRPAIAPISLASLAAVIEKQFPELRERLSSLVELRGYEGTELAPGASKLMQDLLARQTIKAFDKLSFDGVGTERGPLRTVLAGAAAVLMLMAPFAWNGDGYGLLWSRFFVPWGNFAWGANLDLKVQESDQVVARGSDVPIHVTLTDRRRRHQIEGNSAEPLWLNWRDETLASDRRRLDWDDESKSFTTVLPRVERSVVFNVTTKGARSGQYRVDVADPPVMTQFQFDIEPAAYTGLPATSMTSIPSEVRVSEFSRIELRVAFRDPIVEAELVWPTESLEPPKSTVRAEKRQVVEKSIPIELAADGRSGVATITANVSGQFVVRAKNRFGLQNREQSRMLLVVEDRPPELRLSGTDEPLLVRPDELFEQHIEASDDYGLTAVELHLEVPNESKQIEELSAEQRRGLEIAHTFKIDLSPLALNGGQIVTYRIRAVDNRPIPGSHEVWSATRTLMVNTSLKQIPNRELVEETRSLEEEMNSLRADLDESKQDLVKLHEQIEKESLDRQPETDKNDRLTELQQAQERLMERLQQLADRLSERRMTHDLAPTADRIAEENLADANERLEQSKDKRARDQLEPVAQAIDKTAAAERQLQKLERQFDELNKLEQDLTELNRMAQRAERVADQLEKLDSELQAAANKKWGREPEDSGEKSAPRPGAEDTIPSRSPEVDTDSKPAPADAVAADKAASSNSEPESLSHEDQQNAETLQKLKEEGNRLADQLNQLLQKHPELVDAAKRDQQDQLDRIAEQIKQLSEPQERLAAALKKAAQDAPAVASRPENANADVREPNANEATQTPDKTNRDNTPEGTEPHKEDESAKSNGSLNDNQSQRDVQLRNKDQSQQGDDASNGQQVQSENDSQRQPDNEAPKQKSNDSVNGPDEDQSQQNRQKDESRKQPVGELAKEDQANHNLGQSESQQSEKNEGAQTEQAKNDSTMNDAAQHDAARNDSAKQDGAENNTANDDADSKSLEQQQGRKAVEAQEKVARDAAREALDLARDVGADAPATKAALEFARNAEAAKQQAQTGQLAEAAMEAQKAQSAADETKRLLDPDGDAHSPQSKRSRELANQQKENVEQLQQLANSSEAARGAQMLGQRQLADATKKIADKLDQAAAALKSAPLNAPKMAEPGEQAKTSAIQAQEAMKQAERANKQNDLQKSAPAAADAVDKLNEAAKAIQSKPSQAPPSTPVPNQVGSQVTDALKQLNSAVEKLQQASAKSESKPSSSPSSQSRSQQAESNQSQSQSQPKSEGQQPLPAKAEESKPQDSKTPGEQAQVKQPTESSQQASSQEHEQSKQSGEKESQSESQEKQSEQQAKEAEQQASKSDQQSQQSDQQGKQSGQQGKQAGQQGKQPGQQGSQSDQPGKSPGSGTPSQDGSDSSSSSAAGENTQQTRSDGKSLRNSTQSGQSPSEGSRQGEQAQRSGTAKVGEKSSQDGKPTGQGQATDQTPNAKPQSGEPTRNQDQQMTRNAGNEQRERSSSDDSTIAQAAEQFRELAAMLRQARGEPKDNVARGKSLKSKPNGRQMPAEQFAKPQPSEEGEAGNSAQGTTAVPDLSHLDIELQQQARSNWGRLPGQLRTEILQGAGKKSHPEYTRRIKSYFDEITKPAK